jgi:hypothetical protein
MSSLATLRPHCAVTVTVMSSMAHKGVDWFFARVKRAVSPDNLPKSRFARIAIGVALVLGGIVGFLPVFGFWMIPLGVAVLAIDIPVVRKFSRRVKVGFGRWWKNREQRGRQS